MKGISKQRISAGLRTLVFGIIGASLIACDVNVVNPGPAQDEFLDDPGAHQAVVAGTERAMAIALNWVAYTSAYISRETVPSGNLGNLFGAPTQVRQGLLNEDENDTHWQHAQRARWMAEDAIRRFRVAMESGELSGSPLVAEVMLRAGYANRLLGENMCVAVIDGGGAEPWTAYLERAEDYFTDAIQVAGQAGRSDLRTAAYAGRASVRAGMADWPGAEADAQEVPRDFVYQQTYFTQDWDDHNRFFWGNNYPASPFRAHTVWSTYFEEYYEESGDPRTAWGSDPDIPQGTVEQWPWYFQLKHDELDSPINLSSGREMELVRAEAALHGGQWQEASDLINGLRADVGVDAWPISNSEEAWSALKQERSIELWLEGRRLGDLRRWHVDGAPGAAPEDMTGRSLCFPIGESEIDTNPNVSGEDQQDLLG